MVSLYPAETPRPRVSLNSGTGAVDEVTAAHRSEVAEYALQGMVTAEEVQNSIFLGMEAGLREYASGLEAIESRRQATQDIQNIINLAAAEGRTLTFEEQESIRALDAVDRRNPSVVLEELYAKRYVVDAVNTETVDASVEAPEQTAGIQAAMEDIQTKKMISERVLQEQQARLSDAGLLTQGVDFVEQIIPGLSWLRTQNRVDEVSGFWAGTNIDNQRKRLWSLPPAEFEAELRTAIEELSIENVFDAMSLAVAMNEYSVSDQMWNNTFAALDAADVASLGATSAIGTVALVARRGKSALQAANAAGPVARQVTQGNIAKASQTAVNNRLVAPLQATGNPAATRTGKILDDVSSTVPGLLDSATYMRNPGSLSAERQRRLLDEITKSREYALSVITDTTHLGRVTDPDARARMIAEAEKRFLVVNNKLEDSIVDITPVFEDDEVYGGVGHLQITIGTKDAEGFARESQAKFMAERMYRLAPGGYDIVAKDGNWFIQMTQNFDEFSKDVSIRRIQTENAAPVNFMNMVFGNVRTPDDILSPKNTEARKTLTYGANAVMDRLRLSAQNIRSLGKNQRDRLRSVMEDATFKSRQVVQPNGQTQTVYGTFYNSVGDFEQAYLAKGYELPSNEEIAAYFEFRNVMDLDYYLRNVADYRNAARLGMEEYSFGVSVPIGNGRFQYKLSPFMEGRVVETLPDAAEDFTIGWVDAKTGRGKFSRNSKLFPKARQEIADIVSSGDYKFIQVADPKARELRDVFNAKGEPVQFVAVREVKQRPLRTVRIAHEEGGHWMYPQEGLYVKQPQVHQGQGRLIYDGDTTAFHAPTDQVAEDFVQRLETGRAMLERGDPNVDSWIASNLPWSPKSFRALFKDKNNPDAPFSLRTPFVVTQAGQTTKDVLKFGDLFGQEVFDTTDNIHSLSSFLINPFTQERGKRLLSVDDIGNQTNPVFKLGVAPTLDPMKALGRSASQLARSVYFEDYRHRSFEDWVTQFADTLDASLDEVRADPMKFIKNPVYKANYKDRKKLAAAKQTRRSILTLMNIQTEEARLGTYLKQKISNDIYRRTGKKGLKIVEPLLWDSNTDPVTIARSAAFHTTQGLMNWGTFLLQALAATNAAAIDGNPVRIARAIYGYWAMRMRSLSSSNPGGQKMIGKAFSKVFGMDQGLFEEMDNAWRRSGANLIEGEYGPLDDYLNPSMFTDGLGRKALDAGLFFFKEGNGIHRGMSFNLAYLEWRDANPTKKLTNNDLQGIVKRMDDMYQNMSRASNNPNFQGSKVGSWWAKALSVPGQFFGYNIRLTEQLLGTRLTRAEKIRLLAVNGAMYGFPAGVAGTALGAFWPWGESMRQAALAEGYNKDEAGFLERAWREGLLDLVVTELSGGDFNISERYGPNGLSFFHDALGVLQGKNDLAEVLGASPNFVSQSMTAMTPFIRYASTFFGGAPYQLSIEDFKGILREVSTFRNSERAWIVWNSGQWLSQNPGASAPIITEGLEAGDPTTTLGALLGLTPQEVSDLYLKMADNQAQRDAKAAITKEAMADFRRALKAAVDGNYEQYQFFDRRAFTLMEAAGLDVNERASVWTRVLQQNETLFEQVEIEFFLNNPEVRPNPGQRLMQEGF